MKKFVISVTILCLLVGCLPIAACANTNTVDVTDPEVLARAVEEAYAVIVDEEGNIIDYLDVEASLVRENENQRGTGTTYTLTYTARETKSDSGASDPVDGVTATGTITWNDIFGTTNLLVTVSGTWTVGDESISERTVRYGAKDTQGYTLASFTKNPTGDDFSYSPSNCTGYMFYLSTAAKINATGNYVRLYMQTSIFT
ncbi:hypothetical protein [Megamonas hypermegale]|uniref:hypothetical protein n=1 Tax=Megamonas hypermegale TaxID=158847 RepID=UPI0026F373CE|nr:hypothetical protein [Megamonas hypermegale]